jgi:hypothetical protein
MGVFVNKQREEEKNNQMIRGMETMAIRQRWNVPPDKMQEIMDHQITDATDDDVTPRDRARSAGNIIKMIAQDRQEDVSHAQTINVGGSVVIGTDAISAAIASRMALEAADIGSASCIDGSGQDTGSVVSEDWDDDGDDCPAA